MIDFLRYRNFTILISLAIFSSFVGVILYRQQTRGYAFTYSVDFAGGTQILLRFDKPVSTLDLKKILSKKEWPSVAIRDFSETEVLIRVKEFAHDTKGIGERIRLAIQQDMPDYHVQTLQSESVGPSVGATLRWKSIRAILIALIAMLIYIALRFWSFGFAMGAVAALFHDAVVMLAMFLFFDREISTNVICAILAVLGYSINDTIVIFSRIRENLKSMRGTPLRDIINASLNHTLKRTLLTSISTGLPVGVMLIFGGEALFDISFALLIGIVFGTYSSIYIASPIMMLLYKTKEST